MNRIAYRKMLKNKNETISASTKGNTLSREAHRGMMKAKSEKTSSFEPEMVLSREEKIKIMNSALSEISKITINIIANTVAAIRTPNALVTENEYILEFLQNCERNIFVSIRDRAISLREKSELRPLKIKCHDLS
jgi:hypothetical protein